MVTKTLFDNLPDLPFSAVGYGESFVESFPNPKDSNVELLHFIKENGKVSRDDIYSKFTTSGKFSFFKGWELVKWNMADDTYSLTQDGLNFLEFIDYFKEIYEFLEFIKSVEFTTVDELDLLVAMSGKRYLVEKDTLTKLVRAYLFSNCYLEVSDRNWAKDFCKNMHEELICRHQLMSDIIKRYADQVKHIMTMA